MKKENTSCSLDNEIMMFCAYRYAIGRHTYVSTLAYYIARNYYKRLTDERLQFASEDIRKEIQSKIEWGPFNFKYDGTVSYEDRKPLEDLFEFLTLNNIDSDEKVATIKEVEVYHESYKHGVPHQYRITNQTPNPRSYISPHDYSDLIPWMNLASFFDKKHYKKVHVKYDGKEEDVICFETWIEATKPDENNPNVGYWWPWHYKKVYVSVDRFFECGSQHGYIWPDYVTSVEDYNAYVED